MKTWTDSREFVLVATILFSLISKSYQLRDLNRHLEIFSECTVHVVHNELDNRENYHILPFNYPVVLTTLKYRRTTSVSANTLYCDDEPYSLPPSPGGYLTQEHLPGRCFAFVYIHPKACSSWENRRLGNGKNFLGEFPPSRGYWEPITPELRKHQYVVHIRRGGGQRPKSFWYDMVMSITDYFQSVRSLESITGPTNVLFEVGNSGYSRQGGGGGGSQIVSKAVYDRNIFTKNLTEEIVEKCELSLTKLLLFKCYLKSIEESLPHPELRPFGEDTWLGQLDGLSYSQFVDDDWWHKVGLERHLQNIKASPGGYFGEYSVGNKRSLHVGWQIVNILAPGVAFDNRLGEYFPTPVARIYTDSEKGGGLIDVRDEMEDLRYVTCAPSEMKEAYSLVSLVSIFDSCSWLAIWSLMIISGIIFLLSDLVRRAKRRRAVKFWRMEVRKVLEELVVEANEDKKVDNNNSKSNENDVIEGGNDAKNPEDDVEMKKGSGADGANGSVDENNVEKSPEKICGGLLKDSSSPRQNSIGNESMMSSSSDEFKVNTGGGGLNIVQDKMTVGEIIAGGTTNLGTPDRESLAIIDKRARRLSVGSIASCGRNRDVEDVESIPNLDEKSDDGASSAAEIAVRFPGRRFRSVSDVSGSSMITNAGALLNRNNLNLETDEVPSIVVAGSKQKARNLGVPSSSKPNSWEPPKTPLISIGAAFGNLIIVYTFLLAQRTPLVHRNKILAGFWCVVGLVLTYSFKSPNTYAILIRPLRSFSYNFFDTILRRNFVIFSDFVNPGETALSVFEVGLAEYEGKNYGGKERAQRYRSLIYKPDPEMLKNNDTYFADMVSQCEKEVYVDTYAKVLELKRDLIVNRWLSTEGKNVRISWDSWARMYSHWTFKNVPLPGSVFQNRLHGLRESGFIEVWMEWKRRLDLQWDERYMENRWRWEKVAKRVCMKDNILVVFLAYGVLLICCTVFWLGENAKRVVKLLLK